MVIRVDRPPDSSAVLTRLGNTQTNIYAPPGFDMSYIRHPRDLHNLRLASLGRSLEDTTLTLRRGKESETIAVIHTVVANDTQPVIAVAQRAKTLALLPRFAVPKDWTLCLPHWSLPTLEINATSAPARGSLPKVRLFLDALRAGVQAENTA